MANGTETETETRKSRSSKSIKEQLEQFKRDGGQVETLPSATEADAERATVNPTLQAKPEQPEEPVREVPAKDFPCLASRQSEIDCYTVIMSYQDINDYTAFAEDLYDASDLVSSGTGKRSKMVMPLNKAWQRPLNNRRVLGSDSKTKGHVAGIIDYLAKPVHFFPPIVCIPASDSGLQVDGQIDKPMVHLTADSLGVLDGQHRVAAIIEWLDRHPESANESVAVIVLNLPHGDVNKKQQIFADVNRTPAKVSKAIALAFDHDDAVAELAKTICMARRTMPDDSSLCLEDLVTMAGLSPKGSSNQIMSLTNLYNLIRPMARLVDNDGNRMISDDEITDTVFDVVHNLPRVDAIREGRVTFENVKDEYIWPYSTMWQALGQVLSGALTRRDPEGNLKVPSSVFAYWAGQFVHSFGKDGWSLDNERWRQPNRTVVSDGKVGTQSDYVTRAVNVMNDYVN